MEMEKAGKKIISHKSHKVGSTKYVQKNDNGYVCVDTSDKAVITK